MFMESRDKELREIGMSISDREKMITSEWMALSDSERAIWSGKAKDQNALSAGQNPKPQPQPRGPTEWQRFARDQHHLYKSVGYSYEKSSKIIQDQWNTRKSLKLPCFGDRSVEYYIRT